jgi:hypothetical protein
MFRPDGGIVALRPYFNLSGADLLHLFNSSAGDVSVLTDLRNELEHRTTATMRQLRSRVDDAIAGIQRATVAHSVPSHGTSAEDQHSTSTPEHPAPKAEPANVSCPNDGELKRSEAATSNVNGSPDKRGDRHVGRIRPCGAAPGAPSRWNVPTKRDFELELDDKATRTQKFIAALRALVRDMKARGKGMRTVNLDHGELISLDTGKPTYQFPYDGDAELFEGA